MKQFTGLITGISRALDRIAGFCMVAVMLLMVVNILLRVLFNRPILGTYDYVVFLTALIIGLALAHCAVQNGHIAVSFVVEKLPKKIQEAVATVTTTIAMLFWGLCAWQMGVYANKMAVSGVVSSTTQIPLYPFIYIVAFGLLALCLVLLVKAVESFKKVTFER